MKRVLQEQPISNNNGNKTNEVLKNISIKPIYQSTEFIEESDIPYYDPRDIHVHIWKNGYLKYEQNNKDPFFNNKKENNETFSKYCIVCHEKFKSNETSSSKITSVEIINKLNFEKNPIKSFDCKNIINKTNLLYKTNIQNTEQKNINPKNLSVFVQKVPIFNYIHILETKDEN